MSIVRKTYEEAVEAITEIIKEGYVGVQNLTNTELANEWPIQFGASQPLEITDPDSNPNKEEPGA
jgi:hypothetical protein